MLEMALNMLNLLLTPLFSTLRLTQMATKQQPVTDERVKILQNDIKQRLYTAEP